MKYSQDPTRTIMASENCPKRGIAFQKPNILGKSQKKSDTGVTKESTAFTAANKPSMVSPPVKRKTILSGKSAAESSSKYISELLRNLLLCARCFYGCRQFRRKPFHLFLGYGTNGKTDSFLHGNKEYIVLFKAVTDFLRAFQRNRDEEP